MRAVAVSLVVIAWSVAHADGKFFSEGLRDAPPETPRQRAVLVWRDGTETLIVESVVDAKGSVELAWVVPVRSEPSEVAFATPGTVATLPSVLRPQIVKVEPLATVGLGLAALCLFVYVAATVGVRTISAARFISEFLCLAAIVAVSLAVLFPVYATADSTGVVVSDWASAGDIEAAVVRGGTQDVLEWLHENGFRILPDEARAFDDYSNDNWSFVVCRAKADVGASAPRPLKAVFRSERPVYPMKLTGAGMELVFVDLTVIADSPMSARGLDVYETAIWDADAPLTRHPEVEKLAWDGAYVTRLAGTLSGRLLREDVWIEEGGRVGTRPVRASGTLGLIVAPYGLGLLCVSMIVFGTLAVAHGWSRNMFALVGIVAPLSASVVAALIYATIVPDVPTRKALRERSLEPLVRSTAEQWAADLGRERSYRRSFEEQGFETWGRDVPLGIVQEGGSIVWFDREGNPTRVPVLD